MPSRTRPPLASWLLAAAVASLLAAGCSRDAAPPARSTAISPSVSAEAGPVIDQDFPDPDTLLVGDTYYAYATQPAYQGWNTQVARSPDLESWEVLDDDPLPRLPDWATTGRTWAPEVALRGDELLLYFTARSVDPDLQCIGVAVADEPLGPFEPVGDEPLVCPAGRGGAIDAASFVDDDGARYLLWKNDGNCCAMDTWIHLQRLSPDGLRLQGKPKRLIKQTLPWEGELVEAPTLIRRGDTYVLFYSANGYAGADYAIGYATADTLTGPYTKAPEPLLSTQSSGGRYTGPGGQDVITDADGQDYLVFHDWDEAVFYRSMHVVELDWHGATPVVASQ